MGLCLEPVGLLNEFRDHREIVKTTAKHPTSRRNFVLLWPLSSRAYSSDYGLLRFFLEA